MILLTAITSSGIRLAIKTSAGIVVFEDAQKKKAEIPLTLEEALFVPRGLDRVRRFVCENLRTCRCGASWGARRRKSVLAHSSARAMSFALGSTKRPMPPKAESLCR